MFSVEPLAPPSSAGSRRGQKAARGNEEAQGSSTSTIRQRPLVSLMDIEEEMVESTYSVFHLLDLFTPLF